MQSAEQKLLDNGYENVLVFKNDSYDTALIGVSHDNRAIYSFEKMVDWLCNRDGMTHDEAVEWIEYNTIRAIPYFGDKAPIVMYGLID